LTDRGEWTRRQACSGGVLLFPLSISVHFVLRISLHFGCKPGWIQERGPLSEYDWCLGCGCCSSAAFPWGSRASAVRLRHQVLSHIRLWRRRARRGCPRELVIFVLSCLQFSPAVKTGGCRERRQQLPGGSRARTATIDVENDTGYSCDCSWILHLCTQPAWLHAIHAQAP